MNTNDETPNPSQLVPVPGEDVDEMIVESGESDSEEGNIVEITSSGFSPLTMRVSDGESVTFVNAGNRASWPASDVHPTHRSYPGSDISKCEGSERGEIFDACRGLGEGESYTFTFDEKGEWKYHDHLNSANKGTIIVE